MSRTHFKDVILVFQFHKGSIQTLGLVSDTARQRNFNSIKVQFKHEYIMEGIGEVADFNSIKVQFKRKLVQMVCWT